MGSLIGVIKVRDLSVTHFLFTQTGLGNGVAIVVYS